MALPPIENPLSELKTQVNVSSISSPLLLIGHVLIRHI